MTRKTKVITSLTVLAAAISIAMAVAIPTIPACALTPMENPHGYGKSAPDYSLNSLPWRKWRKKSAEQSKESKDEAKRDKFISYVRDESYYAGSKEIAAMEKAYAENTGEDRWEKMAEAIGDKWAYYENEKEAKRTMQERSGEYCGIGVIMKEKKKKKSVVITTVRKESPAEEAGLKKGDAIIAVDGKDVKGLDDAVSRIRGKKDTTVNLCVQHKDGVEADVSAERKKIEELSVEGRMLDGDTAIIAISEFDRKTPGQFRDAVKAMQEQGMKNLIIDLRGNGGGLLDSCTKTLDELTGAHDICTLKNRKGTSFSYQTVSENHISCPVAVLVDGDTASAAEAFTGAVRDLGIGKIVGRKTYGKGVAQVTYPLGDGSTVRFTTDAYFLPNGDCIDGEGIEPDIAASRKKSVRKAMEVLD